jgi:hypothetical protein
LGLKSGKARFSFTIPYTYTVLPDHYLCDDIVHTDVMPVMFYNQVEDKLIFYNPCVYVHGGGGYWSDINYTTRPPKEFLRLYLSFPDPVDTHYLAVCLYAKDDSRPVFAPISSDTIRLSLNQFSLTSVCCINGPDLDKVVKRNNPWVNERWKVQFPLPPLEQLDFDFFITERQRTQTCTKCNKSSSRIFNGAAAEIIGSITALPKTWRWSYDVEEEFEIEKEWVEELGVVSLRSFFCDCWSDEELLNISDPGGRHIMATPGGAKEQ